MMRIAALKGFQPFRNGDILAAIDTGAYVEG